MPPTPPFWLDANVLIEAHNRSYPMGVAVTFWGKLAEQVEIGNVRCPRRVFKEVAEHEQHQDAVAKWVGNRRESGLCILPTPAIGTLVGEIETALWTNPQYEQAEIWQFCKGGDPWVIAHAKIQGGTVVTLETPLRPGARKPRIPDVCALYGVSCVTTLGMFQALGVTF